MGDKKDDKKGRSSFQMLAGKLTLKKTPSAQGDAKKTSTTSVDNDEHSGSTKSGYASEGDVSEFGGDESAGVDDSELGNVLSAEQKENPSFWSKAGKVAAKGAKLIVRTVLDYGPPYSPKFDVALINECARPVLNHMELHNLLNQKINPNLPDREDLYNTPIHWCARNGHLLGIKMLRRAGAKINVTNEMGVTPLDFIVMMKHSPDRRSTQLKVVEYLLKNGALVNNVDKGGFSAIDHAAVNNDLELINVLLEAGAKLRRENFTLVAKRRPILDLVQDPDCYRTLYEALLLEERGANQKRLEREKIQKLKEADLYSMRLHHALDKRKQQREQRDQEEADAFRAKNVLADRLELLQQELDRSLKEKETKALANGVWKKVVDNSSNSAGSVHTHWKLELKTRSQITGQMIYDQNLQTMRSLQQQTDVQQYNSRWRKLTGGGNLEVKWPRAESFVLPSDKPGTRHGRLFTPGTPMMSGTGKDDSSVGNFDSGEPNIFFMDENDDALQDEDSLDDLLSDLQSL